MNHSRTAKVVSWLLVIACMAVIFILSAQTGDESQSLSDGVMTFFGMELSVDFVRSCAHCLEYAGLALLVFNAFYCSYGRFRPYLSFLTAALYAVSDEVHQLFVEGRAFQLSDILIDSVGAAIGVAASAVLGIIYLNFKRRRSE